MCATPPKIDGVIDDDCWKTATHAGAFFRYLGTAPIQEQTEAWICADEHHLYVAFHSLDSRPNLIQSNETLRNGNINNDDYVGLLIDSQNTRHNFSSFQVSARGTMVESLEGGTADNITWAGDWKAAAKRSDGGWTVEMAIPFALLRYARNTHTMGILLTRKLARETSQECWPYMQHEEQQHVAQYLDAFSGLNPIYYKQRPIFLPYALATGGEGYTGKFGLDVKYPFTSTMTGLATVKPDFQDVAQAVNNINFSYNPRSYPDSRPFFAEGSDFNPYQDVFYSRAINSIDDGVKVVGKQDGMKIAALATDDHHNGERDDGMFSVFQDLGPLSDVHLSMAQDSQPGIPSSRAVKMEETGIWQQGQTRYRIIANHEPTWSGNRPTDSRDYTAFASDTPNGKPNFYIDRIDIGPVFTNNVGFVPEVNARGVDWSVNQQNVFDSGNIWDYGVTASGDSTQFHTGGFFHDSASIQGYIDYRSGWGLSMSSLERKRLQFRDHVNETGYYWSERSLYTQGYVDMSWGTQADQHYQFVTAGQGYALSHTTTLTASLNRQYLGGVTTTQSVWSGSYRLTSERTIGMRAVTLNHDVNLFLSFGQKARQGSDVYVLVGDPNSSRTRGLVTLKVVTPF